MKRKWELMLGFIVVAVFAVTGLVHAGELDQTETPAPTMRTLDEIYQRLDAVYDKVDNIPPAWSQKLPAAERFVLVLDGEAVLDRETGLVWEKSPDSGTLDWYAACSLCYDKEIGNRKGWRLPTVEELASLMDDDNDPALPTNHPFTNVQTHTYWSITTHQANVNVAYDVSFAAGQVQSSTKTETAQGMWCVRGGLGHDGL